jgi:hypothetical protein
MINDDCEVMRGMRIGKGKRSTWREPAPVPLCPPQIPHKLTRAGLRQKCVFGVGIEISLSNVLWLALPHTVFRELRSSARRNASRVVSAVVEV